MPTDYEVNLRSNGTNVLTEFISKGEGFIPRDRSRVIHVMSILWPISCYVALTLSILHWFPTAAWHAQNHLGSSAAPFRVKSSGNSPRLLRSILRATPHCGGIQSIEDEPGKCEVKNEIDKI